jgi:hypothetical protein
LANLFFVSFFVFSCVFSIWKSLLFIKSSPALGYFFHDLSHFSFWRTL